MWHMLLHWLQLHSKRNFSSLFLALLLFFHSFCLCSHSLKRIDFSFVLLSMKSQKQLFSRERLILIGRKFQKVWELVFFTPKSVRVLSLTSRGVDSEMNAFKNPSEKSSFFFLFCLLYFSPSFLLTPSINLFWVIQHIYTFNWNFQNRSMCWLSVYIYTQRSQYGYSIPKVYFNSASQNIRECDVI